MKNRRSRGYSPLFLAVAFTAVAVGLLAVMLGDAAAGERSLQQEQRSTQTAVFAGTGLSIALQQLLDQADQLPGADRAQLETWLREVEAGRRVSLPEVPGCTRRLEFEVRPLEGPTLRKEVVVRCTAEERSVRRTASARLEVQSVPLAVFDRALSLRIGVLIHGKEPGWAQTSGDIGSGGDIRADGAVVEGTVEAYRSVIGTAPRSEELRTFRGRDGWPALAPVALGGGVLRVGDQVVDLTVPGRRDLILVGTREAPIRLEGSVRVPGDVVLTGFVEGQGTLIAGRNLYLAGDVRSVNPPDPLPADADAAATDAWVRQNYDRSLLAFQAVGSVLFGDVTDRAAWWEGKVLPLVSDPRIGDGSEDVGPDGVPASGDAGEADGRWTVDALDASGKRMRLDLPRGESPRPDLTPLPGTGEDLDLDGRPDAALTYDDFQFERSFDSFYCPTAKPGSYRDLVTPVTHVDGFLHASGMLAGVAGRPGQDLVLSGGAAGWTSAVWVEAGAGDHLRIRHDPRFGTPGQGRFPLWEPPGRVRIQVLSREAP